MTPTQTTRDLPDLEADEHVLDRERDPKKPVATDLGIARVIDVLDTTAEEHTIEPLGTTVAELNPEYPPDDTVIAVKFISRLDGRPEGYTYEYPRSRLERYTGDVKGLRMEMGGNDD